MHAYIHWWLGILILSIYTQLIIYIYTHTHTHTNSIFMQMHGYIYIYTLWLGYHAGSPSSPNALTTQRESNFSPQQTNHFGVAMEGACKTSHSRTATSYMHPVQPQMADKQRMSLTPLHLARGPEPWVAETYSMGLSYPSGIRWQRHRVWTGSSGSRTNGNAGLNLLYIYIHTHILSYIYICTYIYIYMYTHIHIHTRLLTSHWVAKCKDLLLHLALLTVPCPSKSLSFLGSCLSKMTVRGNRFELYLVGYRCGMERLGCAHSNRPDFPGGCGSTWLVLDHGWAAVLAKTTWEMNPDVQDDSQRSMGMGQVAYPYHVWGE